MEPEPECCSKCSRVLLLFGPGAHSFCITTKTNYAVVTVCVVTIQDLRARSTIVQSVQTVDLNEEDGNARKIVELGNKLEV